MRLSHSQFEALVVEALDSLPAQFRERMDNVEVVIEEWPTPDEARRAGLAPGQLLFGLYQGVPLTRRDSGYTLVPPDKITLYQRPIEMFSHTPEAVKQQVQRTVIHEIAHHFGISDERLRELGW